jgi:DNA-binding GntR family transcriptional regulator
MEDPDRAPMHEPGSHANPGRCIVSTKSVPRSTPAQIADRVVDAILAARVAPGQRLGEQELADVFGVSRTLVREAMARLAARGMVEVSSRRGWFVVQPSRAAAAEAFDARVAIETGMLQSLAAPLAKARIARLKAHYRAEQAAIRRGDAGQRSFLLGDFHVCLADCVSGPLLADILRDLTARTTLVASLYQSTHDAVRSCAEHVAIVAALEAGDPARAVALMRAHIGGVAADLGAPAAPVDPLASLRNALQPGATDAVPTPTPAPARRRLFTDLIAPTSTPSATRAPQRRHKEN